MTEEIRASADEYAVASFQLNRAIIFMLAEKQVLTRPEIVANMETFLAVSEKVPAGARALYEGVVNGIKQNIPK